MSSRNTLANLINTGWNFAQNRNSVVSFEYWLRQLQFVSAGETLKKVVSCLSAKQSGAYLRFGQADINTVLRANNNTAVFPEALILEVRRSFLLSREKIIKALDVDCPALGLPFWRRNAGISDRETLNRLNAVGACFLDWPIYSYDPFTYDNPDLHDLHEQFFRLVRACQPILVFQAGLLGASAIEKLSPRIQISVSEEDIYGQLDKLEGEILQAVESWPSNFPVVILVLGVFGRVLAKRLLLSGFSGYLLDMDNLSEITNMTRPYRKQSIQRVTYKSITTASLNSTDKLTVRWEGPFLGHYSYSIINRELCSHLVQNDEVELTIQPGDTPFTSDPYIPFKSQGFRAIVERVKQPLSRPAEIHVSNHPQHPYSPPQEGHWVVVLPWDFMSLPVRWVDWIHEQVDEVWVPSQFVRRAFLEAGIHSEQVVVVPNGVDVKVFQPDARKLKLHTKKSFKFLFVGGPFWRKGSDILLEAYSKAFKKSEDVCLVIKGVPEFWTDAGSKMLANFQARPGAPEIISIVQSLDQSHMAGLYSSCDCLIHPYRAEGFAMCVAEGMASGLPVIVTGMGATADFCNSKTAYLIPAKLRHMTTRQVDNEPTLDYPSYLEPEMDGLVEWMRYVYEHPGESKIVAKEGMNKIRNEFTWDKAARIVGQRLAAINQQPVRRLIGS